MKLIERLKAWWSRPKQYTDEVPSGGKVSYPPDYDSGQLDSRDVYSPTLGMSMKQYYEEVKGEE